MCFVQLEPLAEYRIVWHYDRPPGLVFKASEKVLRFKAILTDIPFNSPMYNELQTFVNGLHSITLPAHRRIDPAMARIRISKRTGRLSIAMSIVKDLEYGTRKLIHVR